MAESTTPILPLAREIVRDNAIVFIGGDLHVSAETPPLLQQIATHLADQLADYSGDPTDLFAVAEAFELDAGRPELVRTLREAVDSIDDQTAALAQQLANTIAPYTKIVTTRFDRTLEAALDAVDKLYVRIVRDDDVRNFDETRIALVKLRGDIRLDDTLVVTTTDADRFLENLPIVNDVVRAFFATKTFIFLGYNLDDPVFRRLFIRITDRLGVFRRAAYAIVPGDVGRRTRTFWEKANVRVFTEPDLSAFLTQLQQAVADTIPPDDVPPAMIANPLAALANPPRPAEPYKALESYSAADSLIFAGRQDEARRLTNRILGHQTVVVYGESGSGKTSLLQAGTRPRLAEHHSLLVVAQPTTGETLHDALKSALRQAVAGTGLTPPSAETLDAQLAALQTELDGPIVLAIDQFEQLFVASTEKEREAMLQSLQALRTRDDLNLRFVIVIREDFLGRLQTIEPLVPGLLDIRFRLDRLETEEARAAIETPAALFGVVWETDLVDRLLEDLVSETGISPPQLQIVCKRLYDDAKISAERQNEPFQTVAMAQFEAANGTQAILGDYVESVVAALPLDQQETARHLLGAMVSSSRTKLRLPIGELARAANTDVDSAETILDHLREERLVNRFEMVSGPEAAYELTHDYLALRIIDWLGPTFWEMQRAREVLRAAVPLWQKESRLIGPSDLQTISQHRGDLRLTESELPLVYAAAVSYDAEPEQWRVQLSDADADEVLRRLSQKPDAFVRRAAMAQLLMSDSAEAAQLLAQAAVGDADAMVRQTAARSIGMARNQAAVDALLATPTPSAENQASALFEISERWPEVDAQISAEARPLVRSARWQRYRSRLLGETARGFAGGMLALGGLGVVAGFLANPDLPALLQAGFQAQRLVVGPLLAGMQIVGQLLGQILGLFIYLGLFGGAALALAALVRGWLGHVWAPSARWRWLLVSAVAGLAWGLAFVLVGILGGFASGQATSFGVGFVIGLLSTSAVVAPFLATRTLRIAAVVGVSLVLTILIELLPIGFSLGSIPAVLVAALFNAAGFWLAFPPLNSAISAESRQILLKHPPN